MARTFKFILAVLVCYRGCEFSKRKQSNSNVMDVSLTGETWKRVCHIFH